MLDFSWTPQQLACKEKIVRAAQHVLNNDVITRDREQSFDWEGWHELGKLGLAGLPIAACYGGGEAEPLTTLAALEGLGYGCRDNGLIFALNAHLWGCAMPLARFGSEIQKSAYLPGLCSGRQIGALAASEREAGSDVYRAATTALRRDDGYVLNGSKMFITNAPIADVFIVMATVDAALGPLGLTAFIVERGTAGMRVGDNIDKMGLRTALMAEVYFEDCFVPISNRLGAEGNGVAIFSYTLEWERSFIMAPAVGAMQRVVEQCVQYARQRRQFGQPIGKFQAVAHKIVDMRIRLETARLLQHQTAWRKQHGETALHFSEDSAMAKLHVSDAWVQNCQDALDIHGGYGYLTETELERELRDAVGSRLYSGTAEMQRQAIARAMNL